MSRFDQAFTWVLGKEGGFNNRPLSEDPGGATNLGISLRFAQSLGRVLDLDEDGDVDAADIRLITVEDARGIYRQHFWLPVRAQELAPPLALTLFDAAVHSGVPQAVRWLQHAVQAAPDGRFGPRTMATVRAADPLAVALDIVARRIVFQAGLGNWSGNALGWSRRMAKLASTATRWAAE